MEGGSLLRGLSGKILKANLFTVVLFGTIWLVITLYMKSENDRADEICLSASRLDIATLEAQRAERDFVARDLGNPAFYRDPLNGTTVGVPGTNLETWEHAIAGVKKEIESITAQIGSDAHFDRKAVRDLSTFAEQYGARFRDLVRTYHRMGFKDFGLQGEWRKAAHDLETLLKDGSDAASSRLLLELRRDENEYLLRHEDAALADLKKDLAGLREKLKAGPGPAALDSYERSFNAYRDLEVRAGLTAETGIRGEMRTAAHSLGTGADDLLHQATELDAKTVARFPWLMGAGAIVGLTIAAVIGAFLGRQVAQPISALAANCQSAAAELQAAANQQATGTKEQATSMNEISTTINELLASSRQIAESARRVAEIAGHAGSAARSGDQTVHRSQESITGIRRQVDLIVTHMLDLGKKSQEIGGVLEIINELAEQTNILAINATIEAAGGGEHGRRFGVVADEIRKLADRVGGSTKEIQALIEEVRGAVNATVMTTETGSKAVDAGAQQFQEVAAAFKQIVTLVGTNSEAGREIELTTKQQATAVEQVNVGVLNVGQATRELEASTSQTFQTATQLATLSRDLAKLVNPSSNGHR